MKATIFVSCALLLLGACAQAPLPARHGSVEALRASPEATLARQLEGQFYGLPHPSYDPAGCATGFNGALDITTSGDRSGLAIGTVESRTHTLRCTGTL